MMVLKRQLMDGSDEGSEYPVKRRRFPPNMFKGMNCSRSVQESVHYLEPIIRKWVQEAVECAINPYMNRRSSYAQIECPVSRTLQLQFHSTLAPTLFTGSKVVAKDKTPIKVVLFDSAAQKVVTSGPLSSVKVSIVVLDGDFETDNGEDWTKKEFERKIQKNREGKRPLLTGDLTVSLLNGVGYIGDIIFTDNSSWIRSGKFRLAAKVANSDEMRVREARSSAFKVKDHRGESYQKHYPPYLDDKVWRLEKIAKEGTSHQKLSQNGIKTVGDFLRLCVTNHAGLRAILQHISNKSWGIIVRHAMTCTLDDKKYLFRTAQGIGLLFDSICNVVGATFDGHTYQSVNTLTVYHKRAVEDLKQHAYRNIRDWVLVPEPFNIPEMDTFSSPNLVLEGALFQEQDQRSHMDEQENCGLGLGASSHTVQGFLPPLRSGFEMNDSPGGFFIEGNYMGAQLSTDEDLLIDDGFQVKSLWQGNEVFLDPHEISAFSSSAGIISPRSGTPKMNWCKALAAVKWRILVRRNVAARKLKSFYGCRYNF